MLPLPAAFVAVNRKTTGDIPANTGPTLARIAASAAKYGAVEFERRMLFRTRLLLTSPSNEIRPLRLLGRERSAGRGRANIAPRKPSRLSASREERDSLPLLQPLVRRSRVDTARPATATHPVRHTRIRILGLKFR